MRTWETAMTEALEAMVYQFGHKFSRDGKQYIGTMGLSALEEAFEMLRWDDPHDVTHAGLGCESPACGEWATSGTPTPDGYKRYCGKHYAEFRAKSEQGIPA